MSNPTPVRIMIVDDHADLRRVIKVIVSRNKEFELVGEAKNCEEAVEVLRDVNPHIVLVDINMRPVNGIETTRFLLGRYPYLTIVGFSGDFNRYEEREMIAAGAVKVLSKNMRPEDLLAILRSLHKNAQER